MFTFVLIVSGNECVKQCQRKIVLRIKKTFKEKLKNCNCTENKVFN